MGVERVPLETLVAALAPEKRIALAEMLRPSAEPIAIVGIACRFPGGANSPAEFWSMLAGGVDAVGEVPLDRWDVNLYYDPDSAAPGKMYSRWGGFLGNIGRFDAPFFGIPAGEAVRMDPQQRMLLETAWEAIESAGESAERLAGSRTGVFVGMIPDEYGLRQYASEGDRCFNDPYLSTGCSSSMASGRLSYLLDFRGPNLSLDTACSSSLVAVHLACRSLASHECDVALAGGANAILVPEVFVQLCKMSMLARDGRTKAFAAAADGFAAGEGCGLVLLKRLSDAIRARNPIVAVIRGSAVNEDGRSASITAPNQSAQAAVIRAALESARVKPQDVSYIETHGSGTSIGDPIEVDALASVFRNMPADARIVLGAVKTNIGHLAGAAGIAGLIKTALALKHGAIPPNLHFRHPNPRIPWSSLPFIVPTETREWRTTAPTRIAGVSSFGWAGTNVHVVLEQASPQARSSAVPRSPFFLLSAKSEAALEAATERLTRHLHEHPQDNLADAAFTLALGRSRFEHRRAVVIRDDTLVPLPARLSGTVRPVAFVLAGVGEQGAGVGRALYAQERIFREAVDRCAEILQPLLGSNVREAMFGGNARRGTLAPGVAGVLTDVRVSQPAAFVLDWALAQMWIAWGVQPAALLGYSVGEYVGAALAGVLRLEDALTVVARRAAWIAERGSPGVLLAVPLPAATMASRLGDGVWLVAANSPQTTIVGGRADAIAALESALAREAVATRQVDAGHAFHTPLLAAVQSDLRTLVAGMTRERPGIPLLSNVTGTWWTAREVADASYWSQHMCAPVQFEAGVAELLRAEDQVLLELGPGGGLSAMIRQHPACSPERMTRVIASLPSAWDTAPETAHVATVAAQLWTHGVAMDWDAYYVDEQRDRLALPTYPFERQRYWVDPKPRASAMPSTLRRADVGDWFYVPEWVPSPLPSSPAHALSPLVIFTGTGELGPALARRLEQAGQVIRVQPGDAFARVSDDVFTVRGDARDDHTTLFRTLAKARRLPRAVVHCAAVGTTQGFDGSQTRGFYSLIAIAQALGEQHLEAPVRITVLTDSVQCVTGREHVSPEHAPLVGACTVIAQEYVGVRCRSVDVCVASGEKDERLIDALVAEVTSDADDHAIAYRDGRRLVQRFRPHRLDAPHDGASRLRPRGVYLITGGLGAIGLHLAEYLAREVQATLVLLGRSAPQAEQRARIGRMRSLGAEVLVLQADVANPEQMRAAIAEIEARFGALHGVVHAAGDLDARGLRPIRDMRRAECDRHFRAKAHGLHVLDEVLADRPLDFCVLFSSLSAVLGGLGYVGYTAANAFMDAYVHHHNQMSPVHWTSVDWDAWGVKTFEHAGTAATVTPYVMPPADALDAFARVLGGPAHLVNSTGDLDARIREWVRLESLRGDRADALPATTTSDVVGRIASLWRRVLGVAEVGVRDNFFDLGGNSLIALQLVARVNKEFKVQLPAVALFEAPTVKALAELLGQQSLARDCQQAAIDARRDRIRAGTSRHDVAIIGMAGHFPGADSVEAFWDNLRAGVESIARFSDAELLAAGVDPKLVADPKYVKARPVMRNVEDFDAALFGYTPRQAELMDPQQRVFQECAWEALERAGYDTQRYPGLVGVFAGASLNSYLLHLAERGRLRDLPLESIVLDSDKDSLTTQVSYKLNLRGPSVAVQTFCSTSLVAVHMACRSLRAAECDLALAGGVSVRVPGTVGHLYREGDQFSPDGHCRTFDERADGTLFGDGVALVVLKRLEEAIDDGDTIHAVIRGTAINNDGATKVGYTAPSVVGQAEVVQAALADAGVRPDEIEYVEAHGTATRLGDPIEIASLTKAFRAGTDRVGYCAIGSAKPNVGHLDRAAGVSGLIKTVLALEHGELPPLLHFQRPNPQIDFATSPFYVNTTRVAWPRVAGRVRRAAVNSLGVGGTNAHVIVEEAPAPVVDQPSRSWQLLALSARTEAALAAQTSRLRRHLERHPDVSLANVAYTLKVGRRQLDYRRVVVCRTREEAIERLSESRAPAEWTGIARAVEPRVAFLIDASRNDDVSAELYGREPAYRTAVDRCRAILARHGSNAASFVRGFALAQLWLSWGVTARAIAGCGTGELVAACLAGVMSLEDALGLLAARARLQPDPPDDELVSAARRCTLRAPSTPFLSPVSGTWLTADEATDPVYWADRLRAAPLPPAAIADSLRASEHVVLEIAEPEHSASSLAGLLETLGKVWLAGVPIDWSAFYAGERRRRVVVPTYPFERRRYSVDSPAGDTRAAAPQRRRALSDWVTTASWKRAVPHRPRADVSHERCWLLFVNDAPTSDEIAALLDAHGQDVVTVRPGAAYSRRAPRAFTVRPAERDDYAALLQHLRRDGWRPQRIVHLWNVGDADIDGAGDALERGFYSVLALTQALGDLATDACRIAVVSSGMQEVTGDEPLLPAKAALLGPCRTIPCEYSHISARSIDIDASVSATTLLGELWAGSDEVVALRGSHRWLPAFEPVKLAASRGTRLRRGGVYLITGGLGGLALGLAEHLASTIQPRLVLAGRTALPPRDEWPRVLAGDGSPDVRRRIEHVQRLEALGSEVLVLQADVCDAPAMHHVVHQAVRRFGTIHGVLHTAGVPGVGLMQLKSADAAARVLAPKVQGTIALCDAVHDLPLDFIVLFSSVVAAIGGGPGQADYCAANAFMDGYARRDARTARRIISIGWGEWLWDAWQEGLQGFPDDVRQQLITTRQTYGIGFEEGAEILTRVLESDLSQAFVTTRDIEQMVATYRQTAVLLGSIDVRQQEDPHGARHPRPNLSSSYAAPRTELERRVTALWQAMLGIDRVGLDDNFFELGGNSLLGVNLIDRIRRDLGLDALPAQTLFEHPTVAALARHIERPEDTAVSDDLDAAADKRAEQFRHFQEMALPDELV